MTISICLSALFPIVFYKGENQLDIFTASLLALFGCSIIGLLFFSMITLRKLAFFFKSHNPWLLNLQFFVTIIMFTTIICTPFMVLKSCEKYCKNSTENVENANSIMIVAITFKYSMEIVCMCILIYTFR
jgi:hypothetical protein